MGGADLSFQSLTDQSTRWLSKHHTAIVFCSHSKLSISLKFLEKMEMSTGMRGFWPADLKGQTTKEVSLTARDQLEVQFRSHSDFIGIDWE